MELPQIRLQSQSAKIAIRTTPAELSIEKGKVEQSIQQPKADMQITTTPSKLTIDQSEAWAEMNMKGVARFTDDNNSFAMKEAMAGIARRARQGEQLMKIEDGGNPLASQAKENAEGPQKQFALGWIPSHGSVKIDYQPAKVNINVEARKPIIEATPVRPSVNYRPGSVETSISQYQSLQIDFENLNYVGPQNVKISI